MKRLVGFSGCAFAAVLGCGGSNGGTGSGGGDETSASADDDGETTSASADGTTSASASASASATNDESEDDVNDDFNDDGPVGFDLGGIPDTPPSECGGAEGGEGGGGGGGANVELSYIWIANTGQDTISKIDTASMEEEGRYMAKASNGDPSRTSVNLNGDVAVANRNGGVAKFWANPDDCNGSNTSSGLNDVLPWDEEECRAWYHDMACQSNRPVAWTRGDWNENACKYENEKLWTVCDSQVLLLNGETGETEQSIAIAGNAFVYGGAADAFGNFWGLDTGHGQLFRVDHEDYSVLTFPLPASGAYGITVDKEGRPWVCQQNVARFNLDDSTWSISPSPSNGGGCMTDGEDIIWHATNFLGGGPANLVGFDIESLELVYTIPLPQYVHGISVDFQGKVWGVTFSGNNAYRADPETGDVEVFDQLMQAYTYSDMTGHALSTAGGGGIPQN